MAKKQKNLDDITKKFGDERQKALDNEMCIRDRQGRSLHY